MRKFSSKFSNYLAQAIRIRKTNISPKECNLDLNLDLTETDGSQLTTNRILDVKGLPGTG